VRVQFYRPGQPDQVVGVARWDGRRVHFETEDEGVRAALTKVFRGTPVVVDDPSLRSLGARGEVVLEPGSLDWFRTAAITRVQEAGLGARIVPEAQGQGGWDPAAAYRPFTEVIERLVTSATLDSLTKQLPV
jgi:hypothetical protein